MGSSCAGNPDTTACQRKYDRIDSPHLGALCAPRATYTLLGGNHANGCRPVGSFPCSKACFVSRVSLFIPPPFTGIRAATCSIFLFFYFSWLTRFVEPLNPSHFRAVYSAALTKLRTVVRPMANPLEPKDRGGFDPPRFEPSPPKGGGPSHTKQPAIFLSVPIGNASVAWVPHFRLVGKQSGVLLLRGWVFFGRSRSGLFVARLIFHLAFLPIVFLPTESPPIPLE